MKGLRIMRALIALGVMAAALPSCRTPPLPRYEGGAQAIAPFGPVAARVHPLTRFAQHANGYPILIVHVELRDAWGESVKALGTLVVQLYGPSEPGATTPNVQHLVWDVDLSTLDGYLRHWDRATRTYRLQLRDVPEWMEQAINADRPNSTARFVIRAIFTISEDQEPMVVFEDEMEIRP